MNQFIGQIALVVDDYDRAINFYTSCLGFVLLEDTVISDTKRWVRVAPEGDKQFSFILAKATNEEQKSRIGNQSGGRVFLFLYTDNFERDYQNLIKNKVEIIRQPHKELWGIACVFADIYGNLWDLIKLDIKEKL